jgi:hypothetical protein
VGRIVIGFGLCVAIVAGVTFALLGKGAIGDRCLGRCAEGTQCIAAMCVSVVMPSTAPTEPGKGKRRRRPSLGNNGIGTAEPEKRLAPGDDKPTTVGEALGRPEHIDMSKGDEKELDQSEIDRVWGGVEPQLSRCITEAVADWPLESGKIEVGYRIEKDGSVRKVRLTAPALLLRNGLAACMRAKITSLRFPASGGASVVTFPFALQ